MIKRESFELQRIESEQDVKTYIDRLNYALQSGNTRLYFPFHFAEEEFEESDFPYKKKGEIL